MAGLTEAMDDLVHAPILSSLAMVMKTGILHRIITETPSPGMFISKGPTIPVSFQRIFRH